MDKNQTRRLREGQGPDQDVSFYGDAWSFDDQEKVRVFASRHLNFGQTREILHRTSVDGRSIESWFAEYRGSSRLREISQVASLLWAAFPDSTSTIDLRIRERPDFEVVFEPHGTIFVEHSQIVAPYSAQVTRLLGQVGTGLSRALTADPTLAERLSGRQFDVRVPYDENLRENSKGQLVHRVPDRNRMISELIAFIERERLDDWQPQFTPFDPKYSALHEASAVLLTRKVSGCIMSPTVHISAHAFDPSDLANTFIDRLNEKIRKAEAYEPRPLWLILNMFDFTAVTELSLDVLTGKRIEIAPYERVIVGEGNNVIRYERIS